MKIIPKFQQGGSYDSLMSIYLPILIESPRQVESGRQSSKKSTSKDDEDGLDEKEFFKMIKDLDGLPNETAAIAQGLMEVFREANLFGTDIDDLSVQYLSAISRISQAKFNKDLFKETYNRAVANQSLNDLAITTSGKIVVMNNKDLTLVYLSPEKWAKVKNSNQYSPVTNSNLLWLRYKSPRYINDNSIFEIVENGIGLEEVHKMIKDRFKEIGNVETTGETYIPKEAIKGHEILENALYYGPEGIYKMKKTISKSEDSLVAAALNYIYTTLPANAKTRLALETNDGSVKSISDVILSMIFGTLKYKEATSFDYVGTEGRGTTSDGKSIKGEKDNAATKLVKGYGAPTWIGINIGDSFRTVVHANALPIVGNNDENIGINSPVSDISKGSMGRVLNNNSASIAGSIISSAFFNQIILKNDKIITIDFPCIRNENGTIIPDLSRETREKKTKADSELKQMGINPYNLKDKQEKYQIINQIYQKHQLVPPYTSTGAINDASWARFAVVEVAADERIIPNANKSLLEEIRDDYELKSIIEAIQESDKEYSKNEPFLWIGGDNLYKGTMWIPLIESYSMAMGPEATSEAESRRLDEIDQAIANRVTLSTKQPN